MTESDPEQLLQDVLTGEKSEMDPEVQAALVGSPELRQRLVRLQHLTARLDRVGGDECSSVEAVLARRRPMSEVVASAVGNRTKSRVPRGILAAAAILVAGSLYVVWPSGSVPEPTEVWLELESGQMVPDEVLHPGDPLAWNFPLPPGGEYELQFFAVGSTLALDPFLARRVGQQRHWTPTPEEYRELPARLTWHLVVRDAAGNPDGGGVQQLRVVH